MAFDITVIIIIYKLLFLGDLKSYGIWIELSVRSLGDFSLRQ